MAVRLAQAGAVVAVISYTLYPEALASEMAGEVLAALVWTCQEIAQYGGDAGRISVVGHSAGGHLAALALMMLAQQRQQALQAAAAAAAQPEDVSRRQVQQQCRRAQGLERSSPLQQQRLTAHQQQQRPSSQHPQQQQQQQQPLVLQQQQGQHPQQPLLQHHPQQQQQRRRPLWYIPDPLALPQPLLFVGMSSVYDVGLHFEFESMRGVAGISTMARACGGAAMFDAVSPAVLLKHAAAAATRQHAGGSAATAVQPGTASNQQQLLRPVQWPQLPAGAAAAAAAGYHFTPAQLGSRSLQRFSGPGSCGFAVSPGRDARQLQQQQQLLHGEVIPIRIGMQQPHAASSNSSTLANPGASLAPEFNTPSSSSSSHEAGSTSFGDAASLLRGFSVADAAQLPPFVIMSSCGDLMVPWHEAADMTLALQACGVPAKHLIYDRYLHNDFVLDWNPSLVSTSTTGAGGVAAAEAAAERMIAAPAAAAAAAAAGGVAEVSRAAASRSGGDAMPAFAQDLVSIVTGRVQLQFNSGKETAERPSYAEGSSIDAVAAGSSNDFRMGRWFAVQPHARL
jgi:acetyl esterase/lipase